MPESAQFGNPILTQISAMKGDQHFEVFEVGDAAGSLFHQRDLGVDSLDGGRRQRIFLRSSGKMRHGSFSIGTIQVIGKVAGLFEEEALDLEGTVSAR